MRKICLICNKEFSTLPSRIKIRKGKYCSKDCYWISKKGKLTWNKGLKGYKQPNISKALKGKKLSIETRKKMSISRLGLFTGKNNPMWRGGLTSKNKLIRHTPEYRLWRTAVFERDSYKCIWCGVKSGNGKAVILHADHIKPFAIYPELRFAIDNGRTLCISCHRTTETYGRKK